MAYKDKKEHTLELKVNVGKGSRVQNKTFKVPVIYKFPASEDELVESGGAYDIFAVVDGVETKIGSGGAVRNNGKVTITDNASFLKSAKELPGGNDINETNLNASMANGGSDNLKKNGIEKRNANLSPESQSKISTSAALTPTEKEANGLSDVATVDTPETAPATQDTPLSTETVEQTSTAMTAMKFVSKSQQFSDALVFPQNMRELDQDYIKFKTYRYIPQTFKSSQFGFSSVTKDKLGAPEGTCYLPVSNGPKDSNGVSWSDNKVNALQAIAYEAAYKLLPDNGSLADVMNKARGALMGRGEDAKKFVAMQMAQKASGVQGMLSRTSGAIINPNMVLLFSNPELRNFSFDFQLRPRDTTEAATAKKIIRMFKQSMSVRKETTNLFLLAPNIFTVSYHKGNDGNDEHKSIGQIKICALTNISVDYAPDGSYMTFNDEAASMTAYSMSLQFSELEPVYYDDYASIPTDEIGF